ncbi:hypothetical protein BASA81_003143 [Batrachochytrium salamandrivorans]|nr:hypothetical protein BASA81_003143 [Batrachochytrium salamandrivorans]
MATNSKVVVFDLDGTLLDTLLDISLAANAAMTELHPTLPCYLHPEVRLMIGDGARVLLQKMLQGRGITSAHALDLAHNLFLSKYAASIAKHTASYDGVMQGLERIAQTNPLVVMCVCTNKPHELAVELLHHSPLAKYFSPVDLFCTGAKPSVPKKPNTEHLVHAIEQTGKIGVINPNNVLMVGDGRNDILVAKSLGCASIAVTYGYGAEAELAGLEPNHVAHTFEQATEQILTWISS